MGATMRSLAESLHFARPTRTGTAVDNVDLERSMRSGVSVSGDERDNNCCESPKRTKTELGEMSKEV